MSIYGRSQHFSPGDIQFQLVYDRGQCADSSYLEFQIIVTRSKTRATTRTFGWLESDQDDNVSKQFDWNRFEITKREITVIYSE